MDSRYFPLEVLCLAPIIFILSVFFLKLWFDYIKYNTRLRFLTIIILVTTIPAPAISLLYSDGILSGGGAIVRIISPFVTLVLVCYLIAKKMLKSLMRLRHENAKRYPQTKQTKLFDIFILIVYALSPYLGYQIADYSCIWVNQTQITPEIREAFAEFSSYDTDVRGAYGFYQGRFESDFDITLPEPKCKNTIFFSHMTNYVLTYNHEEQSGRIYLSGHAHSDYFVPVYSTKTGRFYPEIKWWML